jgi:hypothetical protein
VYKTLTIFVFFLFEKKKNSWPRGILTRGGLWPHGFQTRCRIATCINSCGHVGTCNKNMCPNGRINSLHVSMLSRVIKTRVHKSTSCTLPRCRYDTWLGGHVATVNWYCSHAGNPNIFCSDCQFKVSQAFYLHNLIIIIIRVKHFFGP